MYFVPDEHLWEEVIKIYKTGRAKAIGVCSFEPEHIESLKKFGVKPAVNQFEISPLTTRKKLIEYCKKGYLNILHHPQPKGIYS